MEKEEQRKKGEMKGETVAKTSKWEKHRELG